MLAQKLGDDLPGRFCGWLGESYAAEAAINARLIAPALCEDEWNRAEYNQGRNKNAASIAHVVRHEILPIVNCTD
jgi:hypothetical protein